jgi:hypothetical protein
MTTLKKKNVLADLKWRILLFQWQLRGTNSIQINVPKCIGTRADETSFVSICIMQPNASIDLH